MKERNMQIEVEDQLLSNTIFFLENNGIDATEDTVKSFLSLCMMRGMNQLMSAQVFMRDFQIGSEEPEPLNIPPGGVCPDCNAKITIGQDNKISCNCRVY